MRWRQRREKGLRKSRPNNIVCRLIPGLQSISSSRLLQRGQIETEPYVDRIEDIVPSNSDRRNKILATIN